MKLEREEKLPDYNSHFSTRGLVLQHWKLEMSIHTTWKDLSGK